MKNLSISTLGIMSLNIAFVQFSGGAGTEEDPYQVGTLSELNEVRNYLTDNFELISDLDFEGSVYDSTNSADNKGWIPISGLQGSFDGSDHSISNLFINDTSGSAYGLFGTVPQTDIKNLSILNCNVTAPANTACLVGTAIGGELKNIHVSGVLNGGSSTGGVFGFASNVNLTNVSADVQINSTNSYTGGLGGTISSGDVDRSSTKGTLNTGTDGATADNAGGLLGSHITGSITNSHSEMDITGNAYAYIGGLVGFWVSGDGAVIENSYNTGTIQGAGTVGGLIGGISPQAILTISNSYSTSAVSASSNEGGLVGLAGSSDSIVSTNNYYHSDNIDVLGVGLSDEQFVVALNADNSLKSASEIMGAINAERCATDVEGPVSYFGEMQKNGNRLHGSKTKKPMQVKGMSLFWSIWGGENFYTDESVSALATEWNVEIVRPAIAVEKDLSSYVFEPAHQMGLAETVIESAIKNDIYVIVDFHTHSAEWYEDEAKVFFGQLAQKYGACDNVIFELYNEPIGTSWTKIKSYAEAVTSEIRKYSDNLVVVGTPNWSQYVDNPIDDEVNDPNIAYTLHFYAGTHGTLLRNKAKKALDAGLALFVTEWGTIGADGDFADFDDDGNGIVSESSTKLWLDFMDEHQLSWANWSVNNKEEGASVFEFSANFDGDNWKDSTHLRVSGEYMLDVFNEHALVAEWRPEETSIFDFQNTQKINGVNLSNLKLEDLKLSFETSFEGVQEIYLMNTKGQIEFSKSLISESKLVELTLPKALKTGVNYLLIRQNQESMVIKIKH
jgi:hypothetical protein